MQATPLPLVSWFLEERKLLKCKSLTVCWPASSACEHRWVAEFFSRPRLPLSQLRLRAREPKREESEKMSGVI